MPEALFRSADETSMLKRMKWKHVRLLEVAAVNPRRFSHELADYELLSFVPMKCVEEESGRLNANEVRTWGEVKKGYTPFEEGDVLFAKITPCMENGKYALAAGLYGGRAAGSTEFHVFRPKRELDSKFLLFFLFSPEVRNAAKANMRGAAGPLRVPLTFFEQLQVPVRPLDEQQRIVAEIEKQFTRLEAGVASLKRVQVALKRYRASVLKAACEARLVPTEAELARRESRSYEPAVALLARILEERRTIHERAQSRATRKKNYKEPVLPAAMVDEQLPKGWTWATWDQIAYSQNGRPFPSAEYQAVGFKLLRLGNLHVSGKVLWTDDNTRCLPQRFAEENPDLIVRGRELVMNLTAQSLKDEFLGRVCITSADDKCLLNQRLARLTPIIVEPEFAICLLRAWRFRRFVDGLNSGSLIQHMFTSQLATFTFPLPPLAEQRRIVAEVERRLSVIEELEAVVAANLQRATRLRQAILTQAFSGNLAR
jgi:type I restriction enzyme S subunit